MSITTIIFDLGGVLVWTHWERVTRTLSERCGLTPEAVMEAIRTGDAYYPFMRGEFDCSEFHLRMSRCFRFDMQPERFYETWNSILAPNEEIGPLVARLKGRYKLALGSNTDVLHYARGFAVQPALTHFQQGILSFEVGCCKPDVEFFRRGMERLGASPQETLFIDDRPENVEAARTLGITGVQFLSTSQLESDLQALGIL